VTIVVPLRGSFATRRVVDATKCNGRADRALGSGTRTRLARGGGRGQDRTGQERRAAAAEDRIGQDRNSARRRPRTGSDRTRAARGGGQDRTRTRAARGGGRDRTREKGLWQDASIRERGQTSCCVRKEKGRKKERKEWATAPFKDIRHPLGVTPHSILPLGVTPHSFLPHSRRRQGLRPSSWHAP